MSQGSPQHDSYPWYDSIWLSQFTHARHIVSTVAPSKLAAFDGAFDVLHTRQDFEVQRLDSVFGDDTFDEILRVAASLSLNELEAHETQSFGRFVVHDHPFFTQLQQQLVPLVSEAAGEPVEPNYNFLSRYGSTGICQVHMDAPEAKWTLDVCLRQSEPWPIHFSQIQPWPHSEADGYPDAWEDRIKDSPDAEFTSYALEPGQAVLFSGSSQWHYRDKMPQGGSKAPFCDLLFFHFIPAGTAALLKPANWAEMFGIPELEQVASNG